MELLCVAVVNGRTATGRASVPADSWESADGQKREGFRAQARWDFQRAASNQLGVDLADEEVSELPVTVVPDVAEPIPVVR